MKASITTFFESGFRTVAVLAVCQALSMTGVSVVMMTTALAGAYLSNDPQLATLPLAMQFVATMCAAIPAALLMRRVGRRIGFSLGQLLGIIGGVLSTYALFENNFSMFIAGAVIIGFHNAFWSYYRFAAAEATSSAHRSKAISYVLAGGVIAAVVGPELSILTRESFAPVLFAGCYTSMSIISLVAIVLLQFGRLSKPTVTLHNARPRALPEIMRQPKFVLAVFSAMVGYGVMIHIMSVTPLSMVDRGLTFEDAAFVIEWHALAMFAPSFFSGSFVKRVGAAPVISLGLALNIVCLAVNLAGTELLNYWIALAALGLGWNFMFVGGTSLLTETYRPEEKEKVQAINDFLIFATISLATFSSGALHSTMGWSAVNAAMTLPLALALSVVLWFITKQRNASFVQVAQTKDLEKLEG